MKKIISLLLAFSLVLTMSSTAFAAEKKVVTVYTEVTDYYDSEINGFQEITENYNKKGLKTSATEYKSYKNGYSGEFDSNEYQMKYKYNKKGKITRETVYSDGSKISYTSYKYDKKGRLIKESEYRNDGGEWICDVYTTYKYKNRNVTVKRFSYGTLESEYTDTYDSKGRLKKTTYTTDTFGNYPYVRKYYYWGNGNIKKSVDATSSGFKIVVKYNRSGKEIKDTRTVDGEVTFEAITKYNSKGLKESYTTYDYQISDEPSIAVWEYFYPDGYVYSKYPLTVEEYCNDEIQSVTRYEYKKVKKS